ncbi:MAG: hypothetical protein E4H38_01600 [Gemmatimonadales bacterium]|nr:MAG: hypothetical protein E4H38_01600 [Gemmatimonadales bacterium]
MRDAADSWWEDATALCAQLAGIPAPDVQDWYRIGDGYLSICSADAPLRASMRTLFRECAVPSPGAEDVPHVGCVVRMLDGEDISLVTFEDSEPLDLHAFALTIFPDRGFTEISSAVPGWSVLGVPGPHELGAVAFSGPHMLVQRGTAWQALAGILAFSRLIRRQRDLLYFHAGSVGIRGQGLLLVGPKGAGKTTLSLTLAARGHTFLGDEISGVRVESLELVPVRRSLAVRDGPRAEDVSRALDRMQAPYEPFPDGTQRRRAYAGELFPGTGADTTRLRHIIFLQGFGPIPRLESVRPGREHLGLLTPLGATMWGMNPVRRARDLLSVVTRVRCSTLTLGPPDETATLLEQLLED